MSEEHLSSPDSNAEIGNIYENIVDTMDPQLQKKHIELEEAKLLAYQDALTDLANRRFYDLSIEREWGRATRYNNPLSLVVVDIDNFKEYNDTYGHQAGDDCLVAIAKVMQNTCERSSDLATRYGGEKFAIILPETKVKFAVEFCNILKRAVSKLNIEQKNSSGDKKIITISLGVATYNPHEKDISSESVLFNAADKALYKAKCSDRHKVIHWADIE